MLLIASQEIFRNLEYNVLKRHVRVTCTCISTGVSLGFCAGGQCGFSDNNDNVYSAHIIVYN